MGATIVRGLLQNLPKDSSMTAIYKIDQKALAEAQELAQHQTADAVEKLIAAGMAVQQAEACTKTLSNLKILVVLQLIYSLQPVVQQVMTVIADDIGCWLISADGVGADMVTIQSLSAEQVTQTLEQSFKPFLVTLPTTSVGPGNSNT